MTDTNEPVKHTFDNCPCGHDRAAHRMKDGSEAPSKSSSEPGELEEADVCLSCW